MAITRQQAIRYCQEFSAGQSQMGQLKSLWDSLLFYCMPEAEHLVWSRDSEKGDYEVPSDDTAIRSSKVMASGIYSYTVARGTRVADLLVQDDALNDDDDVQEYLSKEITIATRLMQSSNYAPSVYDLLRHFVILGTDLIFSYYDTKLQKLNFRTYRVFDCWIEENSSGKVDRIIRSELIKHRVAEERWGRSKLPANVVANLDNPESVVQDSEYLHIVEPNPDYIPAKGATAANQRKAQMSKHFKYREIWVHKESYQIMAEGTGYRTFPYHTARSGVQVNQLPFGRSPAMDALSTLRELHRSSQWMTDASESELRPPTMFPKGCMDPDDWDDRPAGRNVYNPIEGTLGPTRLSVVASMDPMYNQMAIRQRSVEEFFFVPMFRALDQISGSNPTATEVQEAARQGIQGIAPIIGSLEPDVYTTIVERVLDLMDLYGLGAEKPEILRDKDITINVTSQLDAELQNTDIRRTLVAIGQCMEVSKQFKENPDMATLLDKNKIIRKILYVNNVDPEAVYSTRESEEKQKQLAEEQKQQQAADRAMGLMGQIDPNKAPEAGSIAAGDLGGI